MRIGVNCYNLIPQNGGITKYFHNLFEQLLATDRHECVFFWFRQNGDELDRLTSGGWRRHAVLLGRQGDIRSRVGDAAVLFDPMSPSAIADAIAGLWRDADLRSRLAERGRRRSKLFSSARMAELHLGAFEQAAGAYTASQHVWRRMYQPCHMAWAEYRRIARSIKSRRAPAAK